MQIANIQRQLCNFRIKQTEEYGKLTFNRLRHTCRFKKGEWMKKSQRNAYNPKLP